MVGGWVPLTRRQTREIGFKSHHAHNSRNAETHHSSSCLPESTAYHFIHCFWFVIDIVNQVATTRFLSHWKLFFFLDFRFSFSSLTYYKSNAAYMLFDCLTDFRWFLVYCQTIFFVYLLHTVSLLYFYGDFFLLLVFFLVCIKNECMKCAVCCGCVSCHHGKSMKIFFRFL